MTGVQTCALPIFWAQLPLNARRYIERIAEIVGAGVDIISTGPDRNETIMLRDPFEVG